MYCVYQYLFFSVMKVVPHSQFQVRRTEIGVYGFGAHKSAIMDLYPVEKRIFVNTLFYFIGVGVYILDPKVPKVGALSFCGTP